MQLSESQPISGHNVSSFGRVGREVTCVLSLNLRLLGTLPLRPAEGATKHPRDRQTLRNLVAGVAAYL